jgi:predicted transcriptional regulator
VSLKELLDLGVDAPPHSQVAVSSEYTCLQSKTFVKAIKELRKTKGYIEYPDSQTVRLTQAGIANVPSTTSAATNNEQVQQRFKNMLKDKATEVFDILKDGKVHDREVIAASVGYSCLQSKGFVKALKQMNDLNLIEYAKDGKKKLVQLTTLAFPFGRPGDSPGMSVVSNDDVSVSS